MADYTVIWHTTIVDAESPEDAARQAHVDSSFGTSVIYDVFEGIVHIELPKGGKTVDLDEIIEEDESIG